MEAAKEAERRYKAATKWADRLSRLRDAMRSGSGDEARRVLRETVHDMVVGDTVYLYLVDEVTDRPVRASAVYPIEITTASDLMLKLLPVMQARPQCAVVRRVVIANEGHVPK